MPSNEMTIGDRFGGKVAVGIALSAYIMYNSTQWEIGFLYKI